MALVRTFARLDAEGKIKLPRNILVALGLKEHDVVELKVTGPGKAQQVIVSKRRIRTPGLPVGASRAS
jgi:bifunctional DNA-binding transcriptional regulator/antitoxin component of YhaV-PrlF toxin-antitoxin module